MAESVPEILLASLGRQATRFPVAARDIEVARAALELRPFFIWWIA